MIANINGAEEELARFATLLQSIYPDSPHLVKDKLFNLKRNLDPKNPTLKHVQWNCVSVGEGGYVTGFACIVLDKRLSSIAQVGFLETVPKSASELFAKVKSHAHAMGAHTIRGPINFNTWQDFRAVDGDSGAPPFFLEPHARYANAELWRANGFLPQVTYVTIAQNVSEVQYVSRLSPNADIVIELLTTDKVKGSIAGLHQVSLSGFGDTWSFIPINAEEFTYLYQVPLSTLDIFKIFIARQSGKIIGFLVCVLDRYNTIHALIAKSMTVHADYRKIGVGSALLAEMHHYALKTHIERYIISTMQTDNIVIRRMIGEGTQLRTYEVGECTI